LPLSSPPAFVVDRPLAGRRRRRLVQGQAQEGGSLVALQLREPGVHGGRPVPGQPADGGDQRRRLAAELVARLRDEQVVVGGWK
jgi:hypothetical protein